jgi:hypothetical protein
MSTQPDITLTLSGDAALVLDAALGATDDSARPHANAEQVAFWELEGALERQLVVTFAPDYAEELTAARRRLAERGGATGSGLKQLDTEDIRRLDWGDAKLHGFLWENDGRDVRVFLEHAALPIRSVLCHWASDLRVDATWLVPGTDADASQPKHGGPLLSWASTIEVTPRGRWRVSIDLGNAGTVSLECEQITGTLAGR